jgi:hypothetical protein
MLTKMTEEDWVLVHEVFHACRSRRGDKGRDDRKFLDLPGDGVGGALGLHGLEQVAAEDRLMLAAMHLTPVGDLAEVEPVLEQMGERSHAEADTAGLVAGTGHGHAMLCRLPDRRHLWKCRALSPKTLANHNALDC